MKILIFAVLILLCSQSFHVADCASCEEVLAELKRNASKLIAEMMKTQKESQTTIEAAALLCVIFFKAEYNYLNQNYAVNENDARCKAKEFVDAFPAASKEEMNNMIKIEGSIQATLKLANDFKKANDLTCRPNVFLKGCEAELNALRCSLSALLKFIIDTGNKINESVKGCKDGLNGLDKLLESFTSSNNLTCYTKDTSNGSKEDFCKILKAINEFFVKVNENHGIAHIKFVNMQFLWDQILTRLSTWYLELVLGC